MYNKQLDTFLKVAELGSFSKAAQALYITPSAVIQQINALEGDLGVSLLNRTPRGTSLTPAGERLCQEGRQLIERCGALRRELAALGVQEQEQEEIRVGVSLLYQCRAFYELWKRFCADKPALQVSIQQLPEKDGDSSDLIETVYFGKEMPEGMDFLELARTPLVCAVWRDHPLAQKEILRYEDMKGQTLVTVDAPYFTASLRALRREAEAHHINVLAVECYDLSVFSMCAAKGYLLQIPLFWQDIYPQLVTVPCDWDYTLPYGFFYRKSSQLAKRFAAFVEEQKCLPDFKLGL